MSPCAEGLQAPAKRPGERLQRPQGPAAGSAQLVVGGLTVSAGAPQMEACSSPRRASHIDTEWGRATQAMVPPPGESLRSQARPASRSHAVSCIKHHNLAAIFARSSQPGSLPASQK